MNCNIPDIITLSSFSGDYLSYEDAVYSVFSNCVSSMDHGTLFFRGLRIAHKRHPEKNGKSATFWHIVSQGTDEENRLPNLRRYECVSWPFHILENCVDSCSNLLIWENNRKGDSRILLFCVDLDYLIVLSKRDGYLVFWTSYPVEKSHTKRKLLREYHEYMARAAQH